MTSRPASGGAYDRGASYTPADADVGKWLRATASYTDGYGTGQSAAATGRATQAAL
ncbi:MAG: hypothetical protein OXE40_07055 [Gammaproteobacteria bacterium]|nr:hypothetical protein [Gammaproteobacteria bacterium]